MVGPQKARLIHSRATGSAALLLAASLTAGCTPVEAPTLVLRGAAIIDGTGADPVQDADLVVVDGRVACVGARGGCEVPPGADEIDGVGFHVIPGLIDVRTHPRWEAAPDRTERRERLRFLLGVTTSGAPDDAADPGTMPVAGATASSRRPVPRLVVGETAEGSGTVELPNSLAPADAREAPGSEATDPEARARSLAAEGVPLEPRLAVLELAVDPYGLPPGLHRLGELPLVLEAIRDTRVVTGDVSGGDSAAAAELEAARRFVRAFHEAGGALVTGSDDILPPGLSLQEELKALVRAGLPASAALAAATRVAATAIGVADSLGTLEPGKLADFIVLEGDPLADISNIELVSRVAKAGVLHDPAGILETLGDDLGDRTTSPAVRMIAGLLATLLTVLATGIAIRRHARREASSAGS